MKVVLTYVLSPVNLCEEASKQSRQGLVVSCEVLCECWYRKQLHRQRRDAVRVVVIVGNKIAHQLTVMSRKYLMIKTKLDNLAKRLIDKLGIKGIPWRNRV